MRDPQSVWMAAFTPGWTAWGRGIARRALELLMDLVPRRPLHTRAASDNVASLRVLQKADSKIIGTENSFAPGRKSQAEEAILRKA
jgi:RimJ/RimL family protein N-acetyltransferase